MNHRICLIIPYFGKIPAYFDLWALSASYNSDIDFLIISDLPFVVNRDGNVKQIEMSFKEMCDRIKSRIGSWAVVNEPYKLCDYKPAYGLLFEEYLVGYDFWGFCDIDVILGKISSFISQTVLDNYQKILFQGHFCLMKNTERMRYLFMEKYPNVIDYKHAYSTNFNCHFDENGPIAYADEYDKSINVYFDWIFFDVNFNEYIIQSHGTECCLIWNDGKLIAYWANGTQSEEQMYVHLQKRIMRRGFDGCVSRFAIMRDEFLDVGDTAIGEILNKNVDSRCESQFKHYKRIRIINTYIKKLRTGWIKTKLKSIQYGWRVNKKIVITKLDSNIPES